MSIPGVRVLRLFAVVTLIGTALGTAARAGFTVSISVDNGTPTVLTFVNGNSNSSLGPGGSEILNLSGTYGVFMVSGGSADTNSSRLPFDAAGNLHVTATSISQTDTNAHTLTIVANDTGYAFPVGGLYNLTSSSGANFANTNTSDSLSFQSTAIPVAGPSVSNAALTYMDTAPAPGRTLHTMSFPTSGSGASGPDPFTSTPTYTLSSTTIVTLGAPFTDVASGDSFTPSILFNNSTIASARPVPEPGSFALVGLGLGGGLAGWLRRRGHSPKS